MTRRMPAILATCLLVAACGGSSEGENGAAEPTPVVVLTDVHLEPTVRQIADALEAERSDIRVEVVAGPGGELRSRVEDAGESEDGRGQADIIVASASDVDVLRAQELLAGDALVFGEDELVLVVPAGNPAGIESLHDFANKEARTGICAGGTVCGIPTNLAFSRAGLDPDPDVVAEGALELLLNLSAGELDAGLLMRSQAAARADDLSVLTLPSDVTSTTGYSIAPLRESPVISDAVDWISSSSEAGEIMRAMGFRDAPAEPSEPSE
jgi:molybdate transport system substrate-binding protein